MIEEGRVVRMGVLTHIREGGFNGWGRGGGGGDGSWLLVSGVREILLLVWWFLVCVWQ